jgi:hypothetical protein
MRFPFLNERSPETAPRPLASTALDGELIGLCLVLALVVAGHLLPERKHHNAQQEPVRATLTMTRP